jgi:hypothetical protein
MSDKARIEALERMLAKLRAASASKGCPGCAGRCITMHYEYELANGEMVILPEVPERPPCTCGRKERANGRAPEITCISIMIPEIMPTHEDALRDYEKHVSNAR